MPNVFWYSRANLGHSFTWFIFFSLASGNFLVFNIFYLILFFSFIFCYVYFRFDVAPMRLLLTAKCLNQLKKSGICFYIISSRAYALRQVRRLLLLLLLLFEILFEWKTKRSHWVRLFGILLSYLRIISKNKNSEHKTTYVLKKRHPREKRK